MGWLIKVGSLLTLCALLDGCVTTSEIPLAKDVWQIHTETGVALFTGQADKATLRRAAEVTLAQGYSHFVIQNPQTQTGSVYVVDTPGTANTTVSYSGNTAYGTTTYNPGVPIYAPRKKRRRDRRHVPR